MSQETNNTEEKVFDIFNTNIEDMTSYSEPEYERKDYSKIFFEPDPKAAGKELAFVIKFCPNIYAPKDPIPKRYTYKIPVPERPDKNFTWVSPSSIGEPCPVVSAYFEFKDSSDPRLNKIAESLKRKRYRAAVIQILNAPSDPSLIGQFRILRFAEGREIDSLIKAKMNPSEDDVALGTKPVNVFDPFESPIMILKVREGDYGRDFSQSSWADSDKNQGITLFQYDENGMAINPKTNRTILHAADRSNKEYQEKILELLKQEHINMKENWMFNEPDEEYKNKCLRSIELMKTGTISEISKAEPTEEGEGAAKQLDETAAPTPTPTETAQTPAAEPAAAAAPAEKPATDAKTAAAQKAIDDLFN